MCKTDINSFLSAIKKDSRLGTQIVAHKTFTAKSAEYGENRKPWSTAIANLLSQNNIRLFSHQTLATDHIRAGHSVVISTPTASGKSLIYNLPVLENSLRDPDSRALYLFPLKALAQDQTAAFRSLAENWPEAGRPTIAIYDGDTPDAERKRIRRELPSALVTTPEMLHRAILPWHRNWSTFLASLTCIVVDEAHTYRGVFGSHMAQVFRRLQRITNRYGASPTYIFCTATVANPVELATALSGLENPPILIDKSGAPAGIRHFLLLDPLNAPSTCAIELLKQSLDKGLRTIVYCQSRRMTELISLWAGSEDANLAGKIASYRAGYLPTERRVIEKRLARGEIQAVVSTSALELGIDIGGLDVCILVGYPGTISQTLQRAGRVGRGGQESAVFLIAGENALDQYFTKNPEELFSRSPEKAIVDPFNEVILKNHLQCAAAESPLLANEPLLAIPRVTAAIRQLCDANLLAPTQDATRFVNLRQNVQHSIDLRGSGSSCALVTAAGQPLGTMDGYRVWKEAHPGAVYIHRGRTFISREIDMGQKRVILSEESAGWFTRPRVKKDTVILEETGRLDFGASAIFKGRLRISEQVTGYERRTTSGNELLNILPLETPPHIFETTGFWIVIPDSIRQALEREFFHFMGSIHALEHALIGLLPLEVMADRNDFGGISIPLHPQTGLPTVFVYDGFPGGAGLCDAIFDVPRRILESTHKAVSSCSCEDGCPSCIQSPRCGSGNRPLDKNGAIYLLKELLTDGKEGAKFVRDLVISPPDELTPTPIPAVQKLATSPAPCAPPTVAPEPAAGIPASYAVFDVETRKSATEVGGWNHADLMGVSIAVLYDSREDRYFPYTQDELPEMFRRMVEVDLVIGFNSLRFDYQVLAPFCPNLQLPGLPTLDLLQRIYEKTHLRISLNNLCSTTLGTPKIADGLQALTWWKENRLDLITEYCQKDVELTRQLYLYGAEHGHVLYTNKSGLPVRINADFNPPTPSTPILSQPNLS